MKTKMLEAKFHEEKLRMQQKHDAAVQKVSEIKTKYDRLTCTYLSHFRKVSNATHWEMLLNNLTLCHTNGGNNCVMLNCLFLLLYSWKLTLKRKKMGMRLNYFY